jgi:hypothetical protein
VQAGKENPTLGELTDTPAQAICLLNEEAIKAIEPSPYLLGCEKHWSDDSSGTCTCDSNKSSFRTGANETKEELEQIIGVSNE